MQELKKGSYFGQQRNKLSLNGLIITDTDYTHDFVDWHYHENAYFTFLLRGKLTETNKKESFQLTPGSLLFHQWQDPHYNIKEPEHARGFHVEVPRPWFELNLLNTDGLHGSFQLYHPNLKLLIEKLYWESKIVDESTALSIHALMLQIFALMQNSESNLDGLIIPKWVDVVRQVLHDESKNTSLTLEWISRQANVHPVHLSREFSKHFHSSFGDYTRTIKVQRSLAFLRKSCLSVKSIALDCGFADESHFIRLFKKQMGTTPTEYRKVIGNVKNIQLT